ncbi:MAG: hypothetical protein O7G84_08470 [Gammaproteobacteria bacterium]|jgi:hypothetical protein|nr:hypothetical protein [Gammaproteobacteria bacterium]
MPKPEQINDEKLRTMVADAFQNLRSGDPTGAVHQLSDAIMYLLELKPELKEATVGMRRGGRRMPLLMRWPQLGANWKAGSLQAGKPEIEFIREKFALSEAITYYEFTLETAINHDA